MASRITPQVVSSIYYIAVYSAYSHEIGALAVWRLNAKYRWALTGTPLANKLDGEYSDKFFHLLLI